METWSEQDKSYLIRYVDKNSDYYLRKWTASLLRQTNFSWNWAAFFLGPIWLSYRKMYGFAILLVVATFVGSVLIQYGEFQNAIPAILVGLVVLLGGYIWAGAYGNSLYRKRAMGEISVQKSLSADEPSVSASLGREGGTNLAAAIGFTVLSGLASLPMNMPPSPDGGRALSAIGGMRCAKPVVFVNPELYFINNESDFGITVKAKIRNEGDEGYAYITAKLTTSEGSAEKKREFFFAKGAEEEIEFKFPEPTVNASNAQAVVECLPK